MSASEPVAPIAPVEGVTRPKVLPRRVCSVHERSAAMWAGAVADAGDTGRAVAKALGASTTRVGAWGRVTEKRSPGLHRIVELIDKRPTVARALVRRLDAELREVSADRSPLEHVAAVTAEVGDVARVAMAAAADGELDHEERKELLREVFEARRALDALAAQLTRD